MILNVSGRTDIVAFYTEWFMKRYHAGYLDVRNPFNESLVSRINFSDVDLILFCTKNPIPIINKIHEIDKPIIFHVTITPYLKDIEPHVPNKKEIIKAVKILSKIIGKENIIIRYDPIFISERYNVNYHKKMFDRLCSELEGYVEKMLISFLDEYKNVKNNKNILNYKTFTDDDYKEIGLSFSSSAKKHKMTVQTCFEKRNLEEFGFIKEDCLSQEFAYKLTGKKYKKWTARKEKLCNCVEMVDIGVYNSCMHYCKYCYANFDENKVRNNYKNHHDDSTLLVGYLKDTDTIKVRKSK